jgi:hypothetical protein
LGSEQAAFFRTVPVKLDGRFGLEASVNEGAEGLNDATTSAITYRQA